MAVGDSENDLSMLLVAGLGVAMGNASEYVKAQVEGITSSNDEEGVYEAVKKYVLNKE